MKIGIDIRSLFEQEPSGVTEYTRNVVQHLIAHFQDQRFLLFSNQFRKDDAPIDLRLKGANVEWRKFGIPNKFLHASMSIVGGPTWDRLLPDADLLFFPNLQFASVSRRVPSVLTVHDLSFEVFPKLLSRFRRNWHHSLRPKRFCKTVDRIIAISDHTKRDLMELFAIEEEKISVIPHGIDERFFSAPSPETVQNVKNRYHLPDRYVLLFSNQEERKNLSAALQAVRGVQQDEPDLHCVVGGGKGWGKGLRSTNDLRIHFLGYVPSQDRPAIFAQASIFLFPSFYEGFGLPPLEAMAMGVPVIGSHSSSLPEVMGRAGILIDPYRPEEISQAIRLLLADSSLRSEMIQRGRSHVKQFSWKKSAEATMNLFQGLIQHPDAYRN